MIAVHDWVPVDTGQSDSRWLAKGSRGSGRYQDFTATASVPAAQALAELDRGPSMALVQIVPELPPVVGGIGDYASLLATALQRLQIRTTFVVPERAALAERLEALRPGAVLLHYSGYGFARRGAPFWLVHALRRWKARAPGSRLVVMFHELWAFGSPWSSSFWLLPAQRAIAAALLGLADAFLTSTDLSARRLRQLAPDRSPAAVVPVVSNIGEPDRLPPFAAREPLAVVFGRPGMRARVYRDLGAFLPALRAAAIEAILDIGPPLERRALDQPAMPVTRCGHLEPASASAMMLRARFGLLDYPLDHAAKSGIFAAYAAHGLLPLIRGAPGGAGDRLRDQLNLVRIGAPIPDLQRSAPSIAAAANLWYREHGLERAAGCFARALSPVEALP